MLVLCLASPAYATPFGHSWDGNPPGTVANLLGGDDWSLGWNFDPGDYSLTVLGGITADTSDRLEVRSTATDWSITGWSQSLNSGASSTGSQWVWRQTSATTWLWGWEDILLGLSDADFQDRYGMLTLNDPPIIIPTCLDCDPTPHCVIACDDPTPVPEPSTLVLLIGGLYVQVWTLRQANRRA
jgi:hypothetical protein